MNERIKELMIQAMSETGRLMDVQATYQRFAELIVHECCKVCDVRAASAPMGSDVQCEAEDCAWDILKHFHYGTKE